MSPDEEYHEDILHLIKKYKTLKLSRCRKQFKPVVHK